MPKNDSPPITPEGKRAAERIRSLFFTIAAANLVLVAIVIWQGFFGKHDKARSQEEILDRSIAAYNAADTRAFSALFAAGTTPDPAIHQSEYLRDFGKILGKKLIPQTDPPSDDSGFVHEVECEKDPRARLVTKFTREKDVRKLVEWRITHE